MLHKAGSAVVTFYINSLFTKHVTSYNLRDNLRLNLKCSKSKALHDSFTHRANIVWNCLPMYEIVPPARVEPRPFDAANVSVYYIF